MKERKTLLGSETIIGGHVKYPAQLVVKYKEGETKFTLHKDFSRMDVPDNVRYDDSEDV